MTGPESKGRPWTPRDDARLISLLKSKMDNETIAEKLKRTASAVGARKSVLRARDLLPNPAVDENAVTFRCPTCETQYKFVRVEAPPSHDRELLCQSCGGPLPDREGKFALKYFSADGSRRRPDRGRRPIR
jgi:predicted RNA-binding Zn-ribbon protein involved in translation (DUF1610 family)